MIITELYKPHATHMKYTGGGGGGGELGVFKIENE